MKSKYEKDIMPFIKDFDTFVNFILEKDPNLSNKNQVLGKNDCFELNSQLYFQRDAIKASYTQEQYIAIDLFFTLAVKSKLFLIQINSKNKFKLIKTARLEEFLELNIYEKYVFLIESFWTEYEFEEVLRNGILEIFELIYVISRTNIKNKILKSGLKHGRSLFSYYSKITQILRVIGICELELIDNVKNKYDDSIKSIMPTACGIEICKLFTNQVLDYFNVEDFLIDMIIERWDIEEFKDSEDEKTFFEFMTKIFESGLIKKNINTDVQINRKGTYILKVLLDKNLWRKIKISSKSELHELHLMIQKAFDFDNDHMYAFYNGTSYRNGKEFYNANPLGESEEYEDLTIEDAELYKGQQFIYLFDFGDMWEFKIQVTDFIENEETDFVPQIMDSKGESVQQYPDWD